MGRGRPAPAKPAAPAAAPVQQKAAPAAAPAAAAPAAATAPAAAAPATTHAAPAPAAAPAAAPAPAPVADSGPGLGGMLMQGAAMGAGSAVGSMAVGALFGGGGGGGGGSAPVAAAAPADQCRDVSKAFNRCLEANNNDASACDVVMRDFQACQKQYGY
eukprot:Rhum_TRINITY_DN23167_c0_g1::Rhum_TRINITY_DN23167_c0_g1_i1::g.177300::m.177300